MIGDPSPPSHPTPHLHHTVRCKAGWDKGCNSNTRQLDPALHTRSPELFHAHILADVNATVDARGRPVKPFTPLYNVAPCSKAPFFFSRSLTDSLWATVPRNRTLVLASEELSSDAVAVWHKVAAALDRVFPRALPRFSDLGAETVAALIGNFTQVRINANTGHINVTASASGGKEQVERRAVPASATTPGLYPASHYHPMLPATRALLSSCWRRDCLLISQATGYIYPSCRDAAHELIRLGQWRSFNEIYHPHGSPSPSSSSSSSSSSVSMPSNFTTWPLDPIPFTGLPVNERPMRLYRRFRA